MFVNLRPAQPAAWLVGLPFLPPADPGGRKLSKCGQRRTGRPLRNRSLRGISGGEMVVRRVAADSLRVRLRRPERMDDGRLAGRLDSNASSNSGKESWLAFAEGRFAGRASRGRSGESSHQKRKSRHAEGFCRFRTKLRRRVFKRLVA